MVSSAIKIMQPAQNTTSTLDDILTPIRNNIASPPETSVIMKIAPELALAILQKYNTDNRAFKMRKIRDIVVSLNNGGWMVTGDTLKFSDRRLLDGQNRLAACVESGIPFTTHVVFGIEDAAFSIIDVGATRTSGDVLYIAGVANASIVSHVVMWMHTFENAPGMRGRLHLTPKQILELYQSKYNDIGDHVGWGRQLQAAEGKTSVTRGTLMHYAFSRFGTRDKADEFMTAWITDDKRLHHASLLGRRLRQMADYTSGLVAATLYYATAIKAWNAYIENRPINVMDLRWATEEQFPTFKQIK